MRANDLSGSEAMHCGRLIIVSYQRVGMQFTIHTSVILVDHSFTSTTNI